ncbi:hypothetical protein [Pseudothauera rhizosphaerae]|uniref:Uncharacterized protein n=1 Tax=Pseudothauera rhizosphaerae TaxID=2565932 RepID=A0A4S4AAH1_9RHOO|nr:hypothetical protein [Pseudothauera rhizosphaerae]THF55905.1 hypothetical protein E6O51_20175 [Pseudothauera rhizosphaerae]
MLNVDTGGLTRYTGFDFNSFAVIDGVAYGADDEGIWRLDGDTDDGDPIAWSIRLGKQDFGTTAMKSVTNAYLGTTSTGKIMLKVIVGEQEYTYAARGWSEQLQAQRVDIGRGIRANWMDFEIYSEDGDDAELATVEWVVVPLSRRI